MKEIPYLIIRLKILAFGKSRKNKVIKLSLSKHLSTCTYLELNLTSGINTENLGMSA